MFLLGTRTITYEFHLKERKSLNIDEGLAAAATKHLESLKQKDEAV